MKILLLGATGRTGKYVLNEALQKEYELNCLVRDTKKIQVSDDKLKIFEGTPTNVSDLEQSMKGCEAIINVLNISRHSDWPWSKLRTPETFLSDVTKNLIGLAEKYNIRRIVSCSAWGTAETKKELPGWFRWIIDSSNVGYAYRDHERQEELLMKSNLSWTIVRPAGLINLKKYQKVVESYNGVPKPGMMITRITVAKYMVDAIENNSLVRKAPTISGKT
jgi:putative NADH-flavin reductase